MTKDRLKWIIQHLDYEKLTEWEENFVESVEKYFKRIGDLTEKQENIMERLHKEKTL